MGQAVSNLVRATGSGFYLDLKGASKLLKEFGPFARFANTHDPGFAHSPRFMSFDSKVRVDQDLVPRNMKLLGGFQVYKLRVSERLSHVSHDAARARAG